MVFIQGGTYAHRLYDMSVIYILIIGSYTIEGIIWHILEKIYIFSDTMYNIVFQNIPASTSERSQVLLTHRSGQVTTNLF